MRRTCHALAPLNTNSLQFLSTNFVPTVAMIPVGELAELLLGELAFCAWVVGKSTRPSKITSVLSIAWRKTEVKRMSKWIVLLSQKEL